MAKKVWFHERMATPEDGDPGGVTVSRKKDLPEGDFRITKYSWRDAVLWFVDSDRFTESERQGVYRAFTQKGGAK